MKIESAATLATYWTNEIIEFPLVTSVLRAAISGFVEQYIPDGERYAAEKLIKSFAEPIYSLNSLYHQKGIDRIGSDYRGGQLTPEQHEMWLTELKEIEAKLKRDIARMSRHYGMFLASVKGVSQ